MNVGYVLLIVLVLAAIAVAVWWFVYRKKTSAVIPPPTIPGRLFESDQMIPGYTLPQAHSFGYERARQGPMVVQPGMLETEQQLMALHNQPRPIHDMIPDSARHQATNFRREFPVAPRTDDGIMRPINADFEAENRYTGGYLQI